MTLHDDRTFVRHFSWVILFLAAMLIIFIILSFAIVGVSGVESHSGYSYVQYMNQHPGAATPGTASGQAQAETAEGQASGRKVAANNARSSAGTGGAGASSAKATGYAKGKSVWTEHCATCHKTGVGGAPKIGDKAAWSKLAKEAGSVATLHHRAIHGYSGSLGFMPPKGGASGLSDAQVKAAANYMLKQSGVSVSQSSGAPSGGTESGGTTSGGAQAAGSAAGGHKTAANGKSVWTAHCAACHQSGVAGAPRIGDKNAWAGIFKTTDHATLYKHAIEGFQGDRGFMPPKGGASDLSDAQVKAAVDYMINKSGWKSH